MKAFYAAYRQYVADKVAYEEAMEKYNTEMANYQTQMEFYEQYGGFVPEYPQRPDLQEPVEPTEPKKQTVQKPRLLTVGIAQEPVMGSIDYTALAYGAEKTKDEILELLDSGAKLLDGAADAAEEAKNSIEAQDTHEFSKVTNRFMNSLNYSSSGGWLEKNQVGVSADSIVGLLLRGEFGSGANGLTAFMHYINTNSAAGLDWQSLSNGNPEISRIINQATYDKNTARFIEAPEDIMEQLERAARSSSLTFGQAQLTTSEKARIANAAYIGLTKQGKYISEQERSRAMEDYLLSNELYRQEAESEGLSAEEYFAKYNIPFAGSLSSDDVKYLQEILGARIASRLFDSVYGESGLSEEE